MYLEQSLAHPCSVPLSGHQDLGQYVLLLFTDMQVAIEMTVVIEHTMIVRNPQQNMVHVDTMSFSIDRTFYFSCIAPTEVPRTLLIKVYMLHVAADDVDTQLSKG